MKVLTCIRLFYNVHSKGLSVLIDLNDILCLLVFTVLKMLFKNFYNCGLLIVLSILYHSTTFNANNYLKSGQK